MDKQVTFIIPTCNPKLLERCLETLYAHTDPIFYVFVIDWSVGGVDSTHLRDVYKNLMVIRTPKSDRHYTGNLGFAKATNLGIKLVETPYFVMCNDDVEFIDKRWWQGVLDAFAKADAAIPDRPCISVTPGSIKLPDWSLGRSSGDDFYIMPYKQTYTPEDYDHLINDDHYLNEHLTLKPGSVIDGVTFYCTVFKTVKFLEVGLLDEIYYPGGAEDYDYCCRVYTHGYRSVGTTMSWVFHHWSSTLNDTDAHKLRQPELMFGDQSKVWGYFEKDEEKRTYHDIWGPKCPQCGANMRLVEDGLAKCPNDEQTYQMPDTTIVPL